MSTHHTGAVVVGAGVIGSSIALQLARRGYEVTVLDKAGGPGFGSTSASSAVVRFNYSTLDGVLTAWESHHIWQRWRDYLGLDADTPVARFHRIGMAFLDVELAPHERTAAMFDTVGIPYEHWDAAALQQHLDGIDAGRYFPPTRVDSAEFFAETSETLGALYTPDAGYVDDPQLAAANLAAAAVAAGADFRYRSAVVAIEHDRDWTLRLDDGTVISTPIVVNAAGPWSSALNEMAGVGDDFTVTLRPMRQEVHHVDIRPGHGSAAQLCTIADMDIGIYTRPSPGGGLLVGGTEPDCDGLEWVDDPDQVNLNRTAEKFEAQILRAAKRFPGLEVPSQAKGIAGVYDVSSDWAPIYDRSDRDGFYLAVGTSGNQFKNAPLAGEFLATIIAEVDDGRDHDNDPVVFRGAATGMRIDLGAFSRRREVNVHSSGTVLG